MKPGCYLLHATFDKSSKFEESNEHDNTSFAYFQVDPSLDPKNSSKIMIIRSGHGVGP